MQNRYINCMWPGYLSKVTAILNPVGYVLIKNPEEILSRKGVFLDAHL